MTGFAAVRVSAYWEAYREELGQILPYLLVARRGWPMPEIKRFAEFKLVMFFHDENPPHGHIVGCDYAAKERISNGDLLAGDFAESDVAACTQLD